YKGTWRNMVMTQILSFSLIIWILIDRFKGLWENCRFKSYITSAVALVLGVAVAVFYKLDIVVALGLADVVSPLGIMFTALALMGGSSCVAEIMERVSGQKIPDINVVSLNDLIGSDSDDDEVKEEE
ncbi:MAG: hypothetical protein IKI62_04765, partial [Clostridia bacterium]|nr:hypothetical protein [Clostridia bacterium]